MYTVESKKQKVQFAAEKNCLDMDVRSCFAQQNICAANILRNHCSKK